MNQEVRQTMGPKPNSVSWLIGVIAAGTVFWMCPATSQAQRQGGASHSPAASQTGDNIGYGGTTHLSEPDPYGGQLFCPVTGTKLGLNQAAMAVQTAIGEQQPTFLGKLFGQKPKPGAVIYVCCPECADKVRSDPQTYLSEVIADKSCFSFTYAMAPAQRPARVRPAQESQPQVVGKDFPNHAQPSPSAALRPDNRPQP
jgi:hypothetical protein